MPPVGFRIRSSWRVAITRRSRLRLQLLPTGWRCGIASTLPQRRLSPYQKQERRPTIGRAALSFGVVVEARERSAIDVAFDADGALSSPCQFILAPLARPSASLLPLRNRCRVGGASPLNWAVIAKLSQCCAVTSIIARSIASAQALALRSQSSAFKTHSCDVRIAPSLTRRTEAPAF